MAQYYDHHTSKMFIKGLNHWGLDLKYVDEPLINKENWQILQVQCKVIVSGFCTSPLSDSKTIKEPIR